MAEITLETKDYVGSGSSGLDACVPGRPGKPSGNFDRHVEVYVGGGHVSITHYEWRIELCGGPKLLKAYLAARPSFGQVPFKPLEHPEKLVRFVEKAIRRHVAGSNKAFLRVLRASHKAGRRQGREEAKARIRDAMGVEELY